MYWIKKEKEVDTVTNYYLEIIGTALSQKVNIKYVYEWNELNFNKETDILIVCTAPMAFKAILSGYKYMFWSQGCWPEESLMRNNSKVRFVIAGFIERMALKRAEFVFFVSNSMHDFYKNKYRIDFYKKSYIMPCFNDVIHEETFNDEKYKENIFCYVGGTSIWQCFEETIELYSKIESVLLNAKLLLLVKDKEKALKVIEKYGVKKYEIDYVSILELPARLSKVKYGFVLRKDNPVNYVATPTKVLTYISSGVIPIYSDSLVGIKSILNDTRYKIEYKNDGYIQHIIDMSREQIDYKDVKREFMEVYLKYYDRERNIKNISKIFEEKGFI